MKKRFLTLIITLTAMLTCIFGLSACEMFESSHQHDYKDLKSDSYQHWYECSCGNKKEVQNHDYSNGDYCNCGYKNPHIHNYEELKSNSFNHWNECSCGAKQDEEQHDFSTLKNDSNKHWLECSCGAKQDEEQHDFSTLKKNSNKHWNECSCGAKINEESHNYSEIIKDSRKHWNECSCGAKQNEAQHDFSTLKNDSNKHWNECSCGAIKNETSHIEGDDKCKICNYDLVATEGIIYDLSSDKTYAEVIGYEGTETNIRIAKTYQDLPVKTISNNAFKNTNIKSVVIPSSVTSIGEGAFYNCRSIQSVVMGGSVESIGKGAFMNCLVLTQVNYLGTIDDWVQIEFNDNYSNPLHESETLYINYELLTHANITTATKINDYALFCCSSLTSVTLGNSVTSIGTYSFGNCKSLTTITIPESILSIGSLAFSRCSRLVEVINKSPHLTVTKGGHENGSIGFYAVSVFNSNDVYVNRFSTDENGYIIYSDGTDKILVRYEGTNNNLVLPNDITKINKSAFIENHSLTSVVIPNGITEIPYDTFNDCLGLQSVTIPNSVTKIINGAFIYCESLTTVKYLGTIDEWVQIEFETSASNPLRYAEKLYINNELVTEALLTTATKISSYAFYNCTSLESIEIPSSLQSIGDDAFYGCSSLNYNIKDGLKYLGNNENPYLYLAGVESKSITTVNIDSKCKYIGSRAFEDCSSLTNIEIHSSVTSISSYAFSSCSSIKSIIVPSTVTSIGYSAFAYSHTLTIYCEAESKPSGWNDDWNTSSCPVVWGYTKEN